MPALKNDLLLRTINRLPITRVPIWMMRQAGRTDPLYRQLREQAGQTLEDLFQNVEHSIEISLLPKRLGVDAIIIFQDILTPLTPMGAMFHFRPGPVLESPIQSKEKVEALRPIDPVSDLPVVGAIIKGVRKQLNQELPVLGFAGSPMTLAFFMIPGRSPAGDYSTIFCFIEEQPALFQQLLDTLTTMTIDYLNYQIESGVHAVQLFESFGEIIPRAIYERFVQPSHEKIFSALHSKTPSILFVKESNYLDLMVKTGATVLSVGKCVNLQDAKAQTPDYIIFQGNVDNRTLLEGDKEQITAAVKACFAESNKERHILNLNHGLLADTPFENVQHFVKIAKQLGTVEK
ncbi:MAG: uroporphyrinogen decarboxylase [SAR324 cluster bacterium]|nr:uroporphyrinogen decarboxylase [SAR324 cluster bacterium]